MKLRTPIAAALLAACAAVSPLLQGCSKDGGGGADTIPRSKVDARVNGGLYYSTETQAFLSGEVLTVIGARNLGSGKASAIAINLKHYKGPGTYPIDTATQASYTDVGVVYAADSGVVVITDINSTKYAGSFGFRATHSPGSVQVTQGVIDVYK